MGVFLSHSGRRCWELPVRNQSICRFPLVVWLPPPHKKVPSATIVCWSSNVAQSTSLSAWSILETPALPPPQNQWCSLTGTAYYYSYYFKAELCVTAMAFRMTLQKRVFWVLYQPQRVNSQPEFLKRGKQSWGEPDFLIVIQIPRCQRGWRQIRSLAPERWNQKEDAQTWTCHFHLIFKPVFFSPSFYELKWCWPACLGE